MEEGSVFPCLLDSPTPTSSSDFLLVLEFFDLLPSLDLRLDFMDTPFDLVDVTAPSLQIEVKNLDIK